MPEEFSSNGQQHLRLCPPRARHRSLPVQSKFIYLTAPSRGSIVPVKLQWRLPSPRKKNKIDSSQIVGRMNSDS
ncbi:hypothetical protein QLX08_006003 [Tetragonisca angustula]|uniref:Uncharacterized protein n=1 Tax=Tetragonisca angustula TaxID=166442 RepID=A0AAW0ZYN9_9HYME